MPDDVRQNDPLIIQAARLRCEGATWEDVAVAVGRAHATVRSWPAKRPGEWYPALSAMLSEMMPEGEREAVHVLRQGLRDERGDERRKSAAALLRHIRECRAKSIEIGGLGGGGITIQIMPAVKPAEGGE